jgi:hypothetical protein
MDQKHVKKEMEISKSTDYKISVAVFGNTRFDKRSSLVNFLFAEYFCLTNVRCITVYHETKEKFQKTDEIRKINEENNKKVKEEEKKKTEYVYKLSEFLETKKVEPCNIIHHNVQPIYDLLDAKRHYEINVYDIPQLDDILTVQNWVETNFKEFDIIMYVTNIKRELDQQKIKYLMTKIKEQRDKKKMVYLVVVIGGCDNMCVYEDGTSQLIDGKLIVNEQKIKEQVKKIADELKLENDYWNNFIKMSIEDILFYRTIKAHQQTHKINFTVNVYDHLAVNDMGKNEWRTMKQEDKELYIKNLVEKVCEPTYYELRMKQYGFKMLRETLQKIIGNGEYLLLNHFRKEVDEREKDHKNIESFIKQYQDFYDKAGGIFFMCKVQAYSIIEDAIKIDLDEYISRIDETKIYDDNDTERASDFIITANILIESNIIKRFYNISKVKEKVRALKNACALLIVGTLRLDQYDNESKNMICVIRLLKEHNYCDIPRIIKEINDKHINRWDDGYFNKTEDIFTWCQTLLNEFKCEKKEVQKFLEEWILWKQYYMRQRPHKNQHVYLGYCYILDQHISKILHSTVGNKVLFPREATNEKYYTVLSIMNKYTIGIIQKRHKSWLSEVDVVKLVNNMNHELMIERYLLNTFHS